MYLQFLKKRGSIVSRLRRAIKKEDGSLAGFTVCEFNEPVDYSNENTFMAINNKLKEMNDAIKYIVTDDEFSKKYEQHN